MHEDDVDVIDDPAGGEPTGDPGVSGGDGGTDVPADLNDLISGVEEEMLAGDGELDPDDDGEPEPGTAPASKPATAAALPPALAALQSFIESNYGGDAQKFLDAQYESRSESKRLRDELDALKNGAKTDEDRDAEVKARREQDEDIRAIESQISTIDAAIKQVGDRNTQIEQDALKLNTDIESINAELLRAPEDQRYGLERKLARAESSLARLTSEYQANVAMLRSDRNTKTILARDLSKAESSLRGRIRREELEKQELADNDAQAREFYDQAFAEELKTYTVDPKSKTANVLYHSVRGILSDWLTNRGYDARPLDYAGFRSAVQKLMGNFEEAFALKRATPGARGARPAAAPRRAAPARPGFAGTRTVSGPGGIPRRSGKPAKSADELLDDPDSVRERANRIGAALARRQASLRTRGGV